jgi:tRNA threonylcarbamoyl adenosine modification protein (Sua5/YciO/YrdC/YwlC family)
MILKIHPETPSERQINTVVECLRNGGVIIYPTDTIYSIGCDLKNHRAVERVARIKGISLEKAHFSLICYDLSDLSEYAKVLDTGIFKILKKNLPGAFTFILPASSHVPKLFTSKKKTIGIRVPDNNITREIVKELGNPIVATSIRDDDSILEYITDPEIIYEKYEKLVDIVIDGGYGGNLPSTIVNCTGEELTIQRQGKGTLI